MSADSQEVATEGWMLVQVHGGPSSGASGKERALNQSLADKNSVLIVKLLESCSTLCNPMECSPLDSFVHGILQARLLEWVAISSFGNPTLVSSVSCIGRRVLYH